MNYKARISVAEWVIQKAKAMYDMGTLNKKEYQETVLHGKRTISMIKLKKELSEL